MLKQRGEKQADGKWFIQAAERNKGPILDILARVLPKQGVVLEVASGTGQHVLHFAKALPGLTWQPSDPDPELRESIALRVKEQQLANVNRPIDLDVARLPWPLQTADAVLCINGFVVGIPAAPSHPGPVTGLHDRVERRSEPASGMGPPDAFATPQQL